MPISADDVTHFLALARTGRLSLAAEELRVNHTTVGRRIRALETSLGVRLFDRAQQGWLLTEAGLAILPHADDLSSAVDALVESLGATRGTAIRGIVRVACPEAYGAFMLAPQLDAFAKRYPDLAVELAVWSGHHPPATGDFDVAVTLDRPVSKRLITQRLGSYTLRLFANPRYIRSAPPLMSLADLAAHRVIWYVDTLLGVEPLRQLRSVLPEWLLIRSTSVTAQLQAAQAGAGVALLPDYIVGKDSGLVPVLPETAFEREYWVSVVQQYGSMPRVRAMASFLVALGTAPRTGDQASMPPDP